MYSLISKGIEKNSKPDLNGEKKRLIDPNKDTADGELIHLATFGTWYNEELLPVNAVTFDSPIQISNRLVALKSVSAWACANLKYNFQLQWGKVFCANKSSQAISTIKVKELEIEPWVFEASSDDALAALKQIQISQTTQP